MVRSSSHTLAERYAQGAKLRREVARQNHADLLGPADRETPALTPNACLPHIKHAFRRNGYVYMSGTQ